MKPLGRNTFSVIEITLSQFMQTDCLFSYFTSVAASYDLSARKKNEHNARVILVLFLKIVGELDRFIVEGDHENAFVLGAVLASTYVTSLFFRDYKGSTA